MENNKLISSKDFRKLLKDVSDSTYRQLREAYDDFLEQHLTLSMFVCVSEAGEVLEEPVFYSYFKERRYSGGEHTDWFKQCVEYQKAKDKVLFEGFEVIGFENDDTVAKTISFEGVLHIFYLDKITLTWNRTKGLGADIESLTKYGGLTLTPNALKLIYG